MTNRQIVLTISGFLLALAGFVFYCGGLGAAYNKVFKPVNEQIRYDTHKQSQAFIDGTIRDIRDKKLQYDRTPKTDELGRAGLRSYILNVAATVDRDRIPSDLQDFLRELETDAVNFGNPHQ